MVIRCPGCGKENSQGARFCGSCGSNLAVAPQDMNVPPPSGAPTVVLPRAVPPTPHTAPPPAPQYTQRTPTSAPPVTGAPYAPPGPAFTGGTGPGPVSTPQAPFYQPIFQPPYAQAQQPYPPPQAAYARPAPKRSAVYYAGVVLVLLCGILVVTSTFMGWFGAFGYNLSGWEIMNDMRDSGRNPFVNFSETGTEGKLVFSGLCTLIAGGLLVLLALIAIPAASRGMGAILLALSLLTLNMAGINAYSFLSLGEPIGLGAGMVVLIASSFGATVGSMMGLAG